MIPVLDGVLSVAGKILDKFPDGDEKIKLAAELEQQRNAAQLQLAQMQADIDKTEASSINWFVAGWRPAAGWVCDLGLAYSFLFRPLANGFLKWQGINQEFPELPSDLLQTLLFGMLGLTAARTIEKVQDAEGNR